MYFIIACIKLIQNVKIILCGSTSSRSVYKIIPSIGHKNECDEKCPDAITATYDACRYNIYCRLRSQANDIQYTGVCRRRLQFLFDVLVDLAAEEVLFLLWFVGLVHPVHSTPAVNTHTMIISKHAFDISSWSTHHTTSQNHQTSTATNLSDCTNLRETLNLPRDKANVNSRYQPLILDWQDTIMSIV